MIQYLAESENFKVYSIYESVYLKNKLIPAKLNDKDLFITHHYGDPNDALILPNEKFIVISGCGLSIYNVEDNTDNQVLCDADNITWTNGLHQDCQDDQNREVRYISINNKDQLRVFKIDLISTEITDLE